MRKNPSYMALLRPARLLISEKSVPYTIKWSYTIIWQVRVCRINLIPFNLQKSPIPQTSNWSGTFFSVSYSKPALVAPPDLGKFNGTVYTKTKFYTNFTNMHFQNIPIPHLTRTMKQKFLH